MHEAIRDADILLPGEPVAEGQDSRWQAIITVGEYLETEPEPVWSFIRRWGCHPQEDLRTAIAVCLLEHLLEYHFAAYGLTLPTSARSVSLLPYACLRSGMRA